MDEHHRSNVAKARTVADAVVKRAATDKAFAAEFKKDPRSVLEREGFPVAALDKAITNLDEAAAVGVSQQGTYATCVCTELCAPVPTDICTGGCRTVLTLIFSCAHLCVIQDQGGSF